MFSKYIQLNGKIHMIYHKVRKYAQLYIEYILNQCQKCYTPKSWDLWKILRTVQSTLPSYFREWEKKRQEKKNPTACGREQFANRQ